MLGLLLCLMGSYDMVGNLPEVKKEENLQKIEEAPLDISEEIINNKDKKAEKQEESPKNTPEDSQPSDVLPPVPVDVDGLPLIEENKEIQPEIPKKYDFDLYIYWMDGCGPCERMRKYVNENIESIPCRVWYVQSPAPFRDGAIVTAYPASEVVIGKKIVYRRYGFVGYDDLLAILNQLIERYEVKPVSSVPGSITSWHDTRRNPRTNPASNQ